MVILDTSAWIELFIRSPKEEKVKGYLASENCYTSMASIVEISNWAAKTGLNSIQLITEILSLSYLIDLDLRIASLAGQLNFERKKLDPTWSVMDSIILATSNIYNLKILTKDNDFRDLPNAEML